MSKSMIERLEPRQLFSAAPTATFMQYVRGTGDARSFTVAYDGPLPIDRTTLGDSDVRVYGANDFSAPATLVGFTRFKPGAPTLARYRVTGITGGYYKIEVRGEEVADTAENLVPRDTIGAFSVDALGRATPEILPSAEPVGGESIQVLGTAHGTAAAPPPLNNSVGSVLMAVAFGSQPVSLPGTNGQPISFLGVQLPVPVTPDILQLGVFPIEMDSQGGNDLGNAVVGPTPVFMTEIYAGSQTEQTMKITGLDPAKRYRIQYLHGDARGTGNYVSTPQTFVLDDGQIATTPLAFNTSPSNATSNTTIEVAGTTSVLYRMPPCPTRGPSFSGVVISVVGNATPPEPQPRPKPLPAATPRFIRRSVRLDGIGQTFDLAFDDLTVATASALADRDILVTGPRGFTARAQFVRFAQSAAGQTTIATYRIDGVEITGRYTISAGGERVASTTLFYLRPVVWETNPAPAGGKRQKHPFWA